MIFFYINNYHNNLYFIIMICSICYSNFKSKTTLNCSHSFCIDCIKKWNEKKNTCPLCRVIFTEKEIIDNIQRVKTRNLTRNIRKTDIDKEINTLARKINDLYHYRMNYNDLCIPDYCGKEIYSYFKKIYKNRDIYKKCEGDLPLNTKSCKNLPWLCDNCKFKKKIKKYLTSLCNIYKWEPVNEWIFKFNEVNFF